MEGSCRINTEARQQSSVCFLGFINYIDECVSLTPSALWHYQPMELKLPSGLVLYWVKKKKNAFPINNIRSDLRNIISFGAVESVFDTHAVAQLGCEMPN